MDDIGKLLEMLKGLEKDDFTGSITINYCRGGITQVEKNEELFRNGGKIMKS